MLELLNQELLTSPANWNAYLWMNGRHWAVVLLPALEGQLRVYSGHVKMSRFEEAKEAEQDLKMLPADKVFIVLELLVHNAEKDFYPCFSIYPGFDTNRQNVQACGLIEGHTPLSLAEKAAEVIRSYEKYGVVGCNCQHFANDLFDGLGISCPMPEDQWIMKALGRCARVAITANGVFKGIAGPKQCQGGCNYCCSGDEWCSCSGSCRSRRSCECTWRGCFDNNCSFSTWLCSWRGSLQGYPERL